VTTRTVKHVTRDQVSAARALIELRGGIENVDALTAKIGTATPRSSLILQFDERAVVQPTNEPVAHRARLRADGLGDYLVGKLAGSEALVALLGLAATLRASTRRTPLPNRGLRTLGRYVSGEIAAQEPRCVAPPAAQIWAAAGATPPRT